jgi:hypothetical protein
MYTSSSALAHVVTSLQIFAANCGGALYFQSPQHHTSQPPPCSQDVPFPRYRSPKLAFVIARLISMLQAFRAATCASTPATRPSAPLRFVTPFQARFLSNEVRSAIDKAVASAPVVLFMKGTPETPQCGFSRASIQILGMQGVDPDKFTAFNVLEDQDLRAGTSRLLVGAWVRGLKRLCRVDDVAWDQN